MLPTQGEPVKVIQGDCLAVLRDLPSGCIDAVITDPPYALTGASRNGSPRHNDPKTPFGRHRLQSKGFMGMTWDGSLPDPEVWSATLHALKPGGYLLAMGGTRTYHRLACAIEDAGFEVRDCLMWLYGTGFPKGRGCLKPAWEPILLARKPGKKVLPLGIDECRVPTNGEVVDTGRQVAAPCSEGWDRPWMHDPAARGRNKARKAENAEKTQRLGRYPANVAHDGSDEVLEAFAAFGERAAGRASGRDARPTNARGNCYGLKDYKAHHRSGEHYGDTGTAARFFYCAKASSSERGEDNAHPTVKPLALMQWLVRLACPPGGLVLDPFAGSGTVGLAALRENRRCLLIEKEPAYARIARARLGKELAAAA